MIRVEVPGSSFMLCLGPGPSSLLHLTRANAEKPYAGGTVTMWPKVLFYCYVYAQMLVSHKGIFRISKKVHRSKQKHSNRRLQ
jgi:hypothetical protein